MNKKTLFLVITLTAMLILVTSVNASTDNTNTSTTHSISEKTTTTEPVVKEKIEKTQTKELKTDKTQDKKITKTNKRQEKKTTTKIIGINNINEFISAFDEINADSENDKFIINFNEGTYQLTAKTNLTCNKILTINGNHQTISGKKGTYSLHLYAPQLEINNFNLQRSLYLYGISSVNNSILTSITLRNNTEIHNSISNSIYNYGVSSIHNSTVQGLTNNNTLTIHTSLINGTVREENGTLICTEQTTINGELINYGTTIITDNCIIGENFEYDLRSNGTIISNITRTYNGNMVVNNETIKNKINIPLTGNITFINCQINAKITNNGNLTLINSTIENKSLKKDETLSFGNILLLENCTFKNITHTMNPDVYAHSSTAYLNLTCPIITNCSFINNKNVKIFFNNTTLNKCHFINNTQEYLGRSQGIRQGVVLATNANITQTEFINNQNNNYNQFTTGAAWGSALTIYGNCNIDHCLFESNILYVNSTWFGASDPSGGAAISYKYTHSDEINNFNITNSIFKNNKVIAPNDGTNNIEFNLAKQKDGNGADIYMWTGWEYSNAKINCLVENNTFTNNSASRHIGSICIGSAQDDHNITIRNNNFTNIQSTLETIGINSTNYLIENNKYENCSIAPKEFNITAPEKIYSNETIEIKGNIILEHPEFYDENITQNITYTWYINGEYTNTTEFKLNITPTTENLIIYAKTNIAPDRTNIITRRTTTLNKITITPENINNYLLEGQLILIDPNTKITFEGNFINQEEIVLKTPDTILDGTNATFTNTTFTLEANNILFTHMNINNTNTKYPITNTGDNNIITQNTITLTNTEGKTAAIYNKANNTKITYNTLYVDGPAYSTDFGQGLAIANTQTILLIGGNANIIEYNNITQTSSTESSQFGTIEAITNSINATNTQIQYNNIKVTGNAKFNYGINSLGNVKNVTISKNNLLITGERYTSGIQIGDSAENCIIENNNIKCVCHNTTPVDEEAITYGIITTNSNLGYKDPNNITIQYNNIDLSGTVNYGMEIYHTTNSNILDNSITVTGLQSMGIGFAYSPNNYVAGNNITTTGDSNIPLGGVTEEIQPKNVGIQIQQTSTDVFIAYNNIQTYDKAAQDTCVYTDSPNSYIMFNNLTSTTQVGNNAITGQPDTQIQNNTAIQQNSTTQTTTEDLTIGDSTTITARFYDDTYTPAGDGKAIFRVNGKTLRDNQGNVIYADVINGRAELPDVNITQEWTKEDTTIQAIYIGNDNNEPITTTPTTINVTKPEATITLDTPSTATAGTKITLKATVTDGENNITSGRVAFKLNGKTLKNPEGKTLYANVENGIATITYTIPGKTKAKEYTLTAVYTDTNYDRVEAESKLNVVKA